MFVQIFPQSGPVFRLLPVLAVVAVCALTMGPRRASAAYDYAYGVNDPSTGDVKDQQESRDGDQVTGYYRTLDADGLVRTVSYASNPLTGFQARVTRDPPAPHHDPAAGQRSAVALPAAATSYQQHTRPMTGYRYDTVHPAGPGSAFRRPIVAAYGDY